VLTVIAPGIDNNIINIFNKKYNPNIQYEHKSVLLHGSETRRVTKQTTQQLQTFINHVSETSKMANGKTE